MTMRAARSRAARIATLLGLVAFGGCADEASAGHGATAAATATDRGTTAAPPPAPTARIVDSILPVEEELLRFQAGLPAPPGLHGGAPTPEALVRRFVKRLAARDTTGVLALTVTRAEFAHLLYPGSSYTRPPYRTAPGLVWMQLEQNTRVGARRLLRGGLDGATYVGHDCTEGAARDGDAVLWRGCRVRVDLADGRRLDARLFGVIVEHAGQFKLASLQTDF